MDSRLETALFKCAASDLAAVFFFFFEGVLTESTVREGSCVLHQLFAVAALHLQKSQLGLLVVFYVEEQMRLLRFYFSVLVAVFVLHGGLRC